MVLRTDGEETSQQSWLGRAMENAWIASAVEVAFALTVSNLAILISVFVYFLMQDSGINDLDATINTFKTSIKPTEIIVYILGFIAPAIWIIVKNLRLWRHLGLLFFFLAIQAIVVLSTSIIFALSIAQTLRNVNFAIHWAWGCLAAALAVWYFTLVYQKSVLDRLGGQVHKPKPGQESGSAVLAALEAKQ